MSTSDPRHVKAARKAHYCDWCWYELIEAGQPYVTWFTFGEAVTARMHPECFEAQLAWAAETLETDLPIAGTYRRGCWCEEGEGACQCKEGRYRASKVLYPVAGGRE